MKIIHATTVALLLTLLLMSVHSARNKARRQNRQKTISTPLPDTRDNGDLHFNDKSKLFPSIGTYYDYIGTLSSVQDLYLVTIVQDYEQIFNYNFHTASPLQYVTQTHDKFVYAEDLQKVYYILTNTNNGYMQSKPTDPCQIYVTNILIWNYCMKNPQAFKTDNDQWTIPHIQLAITTLQHVQLQRSRHNNKNNYTYHHFDAIVSIPDTINKLQNLLTIKTVNQIYTTVGIHWEKSADFHQTQYQEVIEDITAILPSSTMTNTNDTAHTNTRHKRFIPLLIGVASMIGSLVGSYTTYKFRKQVKTAMAYILATNRQTKQDINELNKKYITLTEYSYQGFQQVNEQIEEITRNININYRKLNNQIDMVQSQMKQSTDFNLDLSIHMDMIITAILQAYVDLAKFHDNLFELIKHLRSALVTLSKGYISQELIPPAKLKAILVQVNEDLINKNQLQLLLKLDLNHYYQSKLATAFFINNKLYLHLQIPLELNNLQTFQFYHVSTIHVPANLTRKTKLKFGPYTKLQLPSTYLAINDNQYAEFNYDILNKCDQYGSLYVARQAILQTNIDHTSCLTAIFLPEYNHLITDYCTFQYYRNISVTPSIFESESHFLLANVEPTFSIKCTGQPIDEQMQGHTFSLIAKEDLCTCSLQSLSNFLPSFYTYCNKPEDRKMTLTYVHNFAIASLLPHANSTYLMQPAKLPTDIALTDIATVRYNTSLIYNNPKETAIDLRKWDQLRKRAQQGTVIYEDQQAEIQYDKRIEKWFAQGFTSHAATFIFSILGGLAAIATLFLIYKHTKMNALIGILYSHWQATPTAAQMIQNTDHNHIAPTPQMHLQALTSLFYSSIILMTIFLLKKAISKLCKHRYTIHIEPFLHTKDYSHFKLQLTSTKEQCQIYIASIKANLIEFTIENKLQIQPLTIEGPWNNATLTMPKPITLTQYGTDKALHLPQVLPIPLMKFRTVSKILKGNYTARLLAQQNKFMYCLTPRHAENSLKDLYNKEKTSIKEQTIIHIEESQESQIPQETNNTNQQSIRETIALPTREQSIIPSFAGYHFTSPAAQATMPTTQLKQTTYNLPQSTTNFAANKKVFSPIYAEIATDTMRRKQNRHSTYVPIRRYSCTDDETYSTTYSNGYKSESEWE